MNEMRIQSRFVFSYKQLAKWLACLYMFITKAVIPMGFGNGRMAIVVLALLALCVLFNERWMIRLPELFPAELVFVMVTLATSLYVAGNRWSVFDTGEILISSFVFGYCMLSVCREEGSVTWFVKTWYIIALLLVGYLFVYGGYVGGRLQRLTLREGSNANALGVYMMFAVWCSLYLVTEYLKEGKTKVLRLLPHIVSVMLFLYVIIETASRKALLACLFVILFWVLFALVPLFKKISFTKRVILFIILGVLLGVVYFRYGAAYINASSTIVFRMRKMAEENITDMHRYTLIKNAVSTFLSHPLFGIGWGNFKRFSFSGQHSHNTFSELLVCTGVVGVAIAGYIWYQIIKRIVIYVKKSDFIPDSVNIVVLFAAFLFIDLGQIVYYNSSLLMIMHLIIAIVILKQPKKVSQAEEGNL